MIKLVTKLSAMFLVICGLMTFAFTTTPAEISKPAVAEASIARTYVDEVPIGTTNDKMTYVSSLVKASSDGNYYHGRHIEAQIPSGYFKVRIINVVGSNGHSSTYLELARNIKHPEYREMSKETYLVRIPDLAFSSRILGLTIKEM